MNWQKIKQQLEYILNTPLRLEKLSTAAERDDFMLPQLPDETQSVEVDDDVVFFLDRRGETMDVLLVDASLITQSEKQLIQMMLEAYRSQDNPSTNRGLKGSKEEREAVLIKNWLHAQLEQGVTNKELPASFAGQRSLYSNKVPLLLYGEYFDNKKVGYQELKRLLQSFFDAETMLIPLMDKEWLILCSEALLIDEVKGTDEEETSEDGLASICLGLYGMMVSEGIGECHLSIDYPIVPADSLLATVINLREAIALGRTYDVSSNIHLPWELQLERMVHHLPDHVKRKMFRAILKNEDIVLDAEILLTLEEFFTLDCNMSETAKKLYIHRNTLSYRLDRFKQETGLDVRSFNDGVLAKIGLLLYKVTKKM